jgi:hypothetical protein
MSAFTHTCMYTYGSTYLERVFANPSSECTECEVTGVTAVRQWDVLKAQQEHCCVTERKRRLCSLINEIVINILLLQCSR